MATAVTPITSKQSSTVPLDWHEVYYYTNCPLVSASNVDQELGWTKESIRRSVFSMRTSVLGGKTTGTPLRP